MVEVIRRLVEEARTLLRQELQLFKLEIAGKAKHAGIGAGMLTAAGVLGVLAVLALTTAVVLALALVAPGWMAGLLTAVLYAAITAFLALRGKHKVQEAAPFVPEQAITVVQSTKQQVQQAWQAGSGSADDAPAAPYPPRRRRSPSRSSTTSGGGRSYHGSDSQCQFTTSI